MKAFTDNRGNSFAVAKGMSTKYPATILLMELSEELRLLDVRMDLEWVRRDLNTSADDLSNGKSQDFEEKLREEVNEETIKWRVLRDLQEKSNELYEDLKKMKEERKNANMASGPPRKRRKTLAKW